MVWNMVTLRTSHRRMTKRISNVRAANRRCSLQLAASGWAQSSYRDVIPCVLLLAQHRYKAIRFLDQETDEVRTAKTVSSGRKKHVLRFRYYRLDY